jgi:hypothetical protein
MNAPQTARSRPYFFGVIMLGIFLIAYALYAKGDVKAGFKMLGFEFSIDAKDHAK